jgi:hypothetical protein
VTRSTTNQYSFFLYGFCRIWIGSKNFVHPYQIKWLNAYKNIKIPPCKYVYIITDRKKGEAKPIVIVFRDSAMFIGA